MTHTPTADICDAFPDQVRLADRTWPSFGGVRCFSGEVVTLRSIEDYRPVRAALQQPGAGRVLVVDGGGSVRRAVVGERSLAIAHENGWSGILVSGAVRDVALTREIAVGLRALGTAPMRGEAGTTAVSGVAVRIGGVVVTPGMWIWADDDGIVVADGLLTPGD